MKLSQTHPSCVRSICSSSAFLLYYLWNIKCPILIAGIASIGLAAAYYSSGALNKICNLPFTQQSAFIHIECCLPHTDSIFWKLFYVSGCLFVAMQNMEEWEEAIFDKTKNLIELKSISLYALILTLWKKGQEKGTYQCTSVYLGQWIFCQVCLRVKNIRS